MSVLSARSRACTDAALAFLASGPDRPWPTGSIEDATGYGPRYGQLLYRMLDRLYRLGRLGREGGRGTQWFSVHWRWWPDEGNCDTAWSPVVPARCGPADCMRPRGCQGCRFWSARNLGRPL